jgi:glycosyltransferase involved in cell wall biosynthesis
MIECVLDQGFDDFEFIIVDNGSTDGSGGIADGYAKRDRRIRVIHRGRGNIGIGRNTGLDAASGEYAAFVDDDDTCTPDYLRFLYDLAVDNGADISICGATWADIDEKEIMSPERAIEILLWRKRYNVAFPTKLFKRELFENNRFLETGRYDDIYLMPRILACANKVAYHGLSKYHFNRHENNNSAWTQNHNLLDVDTLREYLDVYDERTAWLTVRFPDSADKWRYFNRSFMLSMVEKVTRLKLEACYGVRDRVAADLAACVDEFMDSAYAPDFEKKWMREYICLIKKGFKKCKDL